MTRRVYGVQVGEEVLGCMQLPVDPEHLGLVGEDEAEDLLAATEGGQGDGDERLSVPRLQQLPQHLVVQQLNRRFEHLLK